MARIRTIKPEFWTSEQVVECSPTARLLFIGVWNFCDDAGIHPAAPKTLKMRIFPGDDITVDQINGYLAELEANRLIHRYIAQGVEYIEVTGWERHQKVDKPNFKYPRYSEKLDDHSTTAREPFGDCSSTTLRPFDDRSPPEGKGREGSLREISIVGSSEANPVKADGCAAQVVDPVSEMGEAACRAGGLPQTQIAADFATLAQWIGAGWTVAQVEQAITSCRARDPTRVPRSLRYYTRAIADHIATINAPIEAGHVNRNRKTGPVSQDERRRRLGAAAVE